MAQARQSIAAGSARFLVSRFAVTLALALPAFAAAPDPAVFRLIPPDAEIAVGVDAPRTEGNPINELFSLPPDLGNLDYYIRAEKNTATEYWLFEIQIGEFALLPAAQQSYRGIPMAEFSWGIAAQIAPNIRIVGFEENLHSAIDRWLGPAAEPSPEQAAAAPPEPAPEPSSESSSDLAPFVQSAARAAMDFNNWIVIRHPVDLLNDLGETRNLPGFIVNALGRVGEATGGVLLGPSINLYAELTCDSPADASAIATLGSVLPTLLKTINTDPLFTRLINIAQGFTVHAEGNKARAMAYLPADGVQEIVDEMNGSLLQP